MARKYVAIPIVSLMLLLSCGKENPSSSGQAAESPEVVAERTRLVNQVRDDRIIYMTQLRTKGAPAREISEAEDIHQELLNSVSACGGSAPIDVYRCFQKHRQEADHKLVTSALKSLGKR